MAEARQWLANLWVGNVFGDLALRVGEGDSGEVGVLGRRIPGGGGARLEEDGEGIG